MRKPRDFDTELKALEDKARGLKTRKGRQLGELVIATGADARTQPVGREQSNRSCLVVRRRHAAGASL